MVEAQDLATWLTPTYLFILLNIILATIFFNHHSKTNKHNHLHQNATVSSPASQPHSQPQLTRSPSLFSRVASFNFSHYYHSEPSHASLHPDTAAEAETEVEVERVTRAPSLMHRVASFKFGWTPPQGKNVSEQEEVEVARESHVMRKDEEKVEVKVKKKVVKKKKVKKEVVDDVAKVEEKTTAFKREDDEEVDSKADDFINKFKQQLKLQRLESMLRYRNNDTS